MPREESAENREGAASRHTALVQMSYQLSQALRDPAADMDALEKEFREFWTEHMGGSIDEAEFKRLWQQLSLPPQELDAWLRKGLEEHPISSPW